MRRETADAVAEISLISARQDRSLAERAEIARSIDKMLAGGASAIPRRRNKRR
jgi:hypothetical protein